MPGGRVAKSQTPEERAAAKARKEARRRQQEAAEKAAIAKERKGREDQLEVLVSLAQNLDTVARDLRSRAKQRAALDDHVTGMYEEVDKLAKGKSLLQVSDLVLEETNAVIRQTKSMITDDVHLDRVKEFVAAGDNPVYPDVLVVLRAVRQALHRHEEQLDRAIKRVTSRLLEAYTFIPAIRVLLDTGELPTRRAVQTEAGAFANLDDGWFDHDRLGGLYTFKLQTFDRLDLQAYLAAELGNLDVLDDD
jgi:hypothetical protein